MIAIFHTICIIARYVYVVLSESLLAQLQENTVKEVEGSSDRSKYQIGPCDSEFEEGYGPRFYPQVYVQRYCSVKAALEDERWKGSIRKVVDFGCSELGFFPYLKRLAGVQEILAVDVDHDTLEQHYCRVSPLNSDYLCPRSEPLTVFVFEGSIAETDQCLIGCDAVVCIELIEHVYPNVLEDIPYTVFGYIKPRVAVFTTPNGEFNVLFPNSQGFRHPDHKFEWTRSQFECWANNIVARYRDYKVSFHDIGWGPTGTEDVGACTQMAVFARYFSCTSDISKTSIDYMIDNTARKYNLLRKTEYPVHVDTRSEREKLRDQAEYSIRMFSSSEDFLEDDKILIPLSLVLPFVSNWTSSLEELEEILRETQWEFTTNHSGSLAVVFPTDDSSVSEDEPDEPCDNCLVKLKDLEHYQEDNWDDVETSEAKWDCDSTDINFQSTDHFDSIDNSMNKQYSAPLSSSEPIIELCDVETEGIIVPSTSEKNSFCDTDNLRKKGTNTSSIPINSEPIVSKNIFSSSEHGVSIESKPILPSKPSRSLNTKWDDQNFVQSIENVSAVECISCCELKENKDTSHSVELSEHSDKQKCYSDTLPIYSGSVGLTDNTQPNTIALSTSPRTSNGKCSFEQQHHTDVALHFLKCTPSNNLYLNLQTETHGTIVEMSKKQEGPSDSPAAASVSLEEPNDRLADSGYPNSTSAQDMELDLTPEQVDELFTENDAVTDHLPDHHSDSVSISSRDSDSVSEQQHLIDPAPVVMPQPDMLFEEAMNVENGDVANNNRDGEGNNALAVGVLMHEVHGNAEDDNAVAVGIALPENLDELIPLLAAAEDLDNDNEIEINVVEPFPPWLLNLLGLANGGGGRGAGGGAVEDIQEAESSDEGDSENNLVIDEGLGDENNLDSSFSDSCASEVGLELDVGEEVLGADP